MFKKTLVAAALATATMGASAWQVAQNDTSSLEVYGVTAISIVTTEPGAEGANSQGWGLENESRVGFRGHKELSPGFTAFVQIESGWVDNQDWAHGTQGGTLGQRDTFVGLKGDWGKVRFGRVLTPMFEIVDWPFSNPGMGGVFDWNSDIGAFNRDRHSNQIRYDSPSMAGWNVALTTGRGESQSWASKGISGFPVEDNYFYGASVGTRFADMVSVNVGIETEMDRMQAAGLSDTFGAIAGVQVSLPAGFAVKGAVKYGSVTDQASDIESTQLFTSLIGEYWTGNIGMRLGYAMAFNPEVDGTEAKDKEDNVISFQPMYVLGGAVFYGRVKAQTMNAADDADITVRLGLEYGF